MARFLLPTLVLGGAVALAAPAVRAADPQPPQNLPPRLVELLRDGPEKFLERYDKNKDGVLTPDEAPPFLKRAFEKADTNGDGKLDREELTAFYRVMRRRFGDGAGQGGDQGDRGVALLLALFDRNNDGKISKDEAGGRLADHFDRLDANKDGFLDKDELRRAVNILLASPAVRPAVARTVRPQAQSSAMPDFDALDRDADGRLTRDEVKGTPLADRFDQIDTNKDGQIDRKEFKEYFRKQAEKKEP
jgi:Ca2+-binding EF-hand superfamily protein